MTLVFIPYAIAVGEAPRTVGIVYILVLGGSLLLPTLAPPLKVPPVRETYFNFLMGLWGLAGVSTWFLFFWVAAQEID